MGISGFVQKCLLRDRPFEFLGGGVFLVRPSFFFLLPENQDIFLDRLKDRIFFFGQSESRFFFFDNHMNHHQSLMSHCQISSKFLSVSYLKKTADVIINFFSSHDTTDHTC